MTDNNKKGIFRRFVGIFEGLRRFFGNMVFLALLIGIVVAVFSERPQIPKRAALVLNPAGVVVDQLAPLDPLTAISGQEQQAESLLKDMIKAVDKARDDDRVQMLVLALNGLEHIGLSKTLELGQAIERFRSTGKAVVATADSYDQDQYLLATQADEIYLHPMGAVVLEGFSVYRQYFRSALKKLSVDFHVFKVGEFKSALEPFVRDDMSEEAREANIGWLEQLWAVYKQTLIQRRGIEESNFDHYVNHIDRVLAAHEGDAAAAAKSARLVDGLVTRAEFRKMMISRVGDNDEGSFNQIGYRNYLSWSEVLPDTTEKRVGVIVASGMIVDGDQPPGVVGGDSLARLIARARDDKHIRSLVLRVDSGGGSAFASEIIRNELLKFKQSGKPVLVSMGSIAASGGYWIAADADEIWATPGTLTGSIGIFGAFPTVQRSLAEIGVHTDGVGTTDVAGALRIDRPLNPIVGRALQSGVEHGYRQFLTIVAEGRNMLVEQVASLAEGRVWSAQDAVQLGLVDRLGSLDDVIEAAAQLASLDDYSVEWVEPPLSPMEELASILLGEQIQSGLAQRFSAGWRWMAPVLKPLAQLSAMDDPRGIYAYCPTCMAP